MESKDNQVVKRRGWTLRGLSPTPTVKSIPVERLIQSLQPEKPLDPNVTGAARTPGAVLPQGTTNDIPGFVPPAAPAAPGPPPQLQQ